MTKWDVRKSVLVTGGAGILGRGFCEALMTAGSQVACLDRVPESDQWVQEHLGKNPGSFSYHQCDLSNEADISRCVGEIYQHWGQIDVVVNNAASKGADLKKFFAPLEDFDLQTWKEIMSVNIDAMFLLAKHVGPKMIKGKRKGHFIQISSIYGCLAPDQRIYEGSEYLGRAINTPLVYSASKAAVLGLTKYLATYWGASGIRANSISPGGVESGQNSVFTKSYSHRVPLGRMGKISDMTSALLFLVSDESEYINGQNLMVDGGLSAW